MVFLPQPMVTRNRGYASRQPGRVQLGQRAALYCGSRPPVSRVSVKNRTSSRWLRGDWLLQGDRVRNEARPCGFECELTRERIRSGVAAAKARGKRFDRQPGEWPKIRPARAAGPCGRRKGARLSLELARGRAKQERRCQHHQCQPHQGASGRLINVASLTRMLGLGHLSVSLATWVGSTVETSTARQDFW